jgi:(p)ppGpp synthase/HD superfamily hydrolase
MISFDLIGIAQAIAERAHSGQFRRDGITPYIKHPQDVASRVETEEQKIVAVLHDTIEDTELTLDDLRAVGFPEEIVNAIAAMTKTEGQDYDQYLIGVKSDPLARVVKIADMNANLSDSPTERQIEKYHKGLAFLES